MRAAYPETSADRCTAALLLEIDLVGLVRNRRGPSGECRGPEYLRIIFKPDYLLPENLERLRSRSTFAKRSLALREFALGIEALERFVDCRPLPKLR